MASVPIVVRATLEHHGPARRVRIELHNRSKAPVSVVLLDDYLTLELKDVRGQFVRGVREQSGALPTKNDYQLLPPNGAAALVFELNPTSTDERDGSHGVNLGAFRFRGIPDQTVLRVTYRAEQMMPNLPSNQRTLFFRGPADGEGAIDSLAGA